MRSDLERLQGIWSVTALESEGQKLPAAMFENGRITVKGNRFASTGMGTVYEGTIDLNESAKPRQLTMKFDAGPEKGNTNLCIYELDGDTWKMCIATRGNVRPTRFESKPGSGFAVETLRRGNVPVTAKAKKSAVRSNAPATELEGEWQMVSAVFDGKPMEASETKWVKRVTQGDQTTVTAGPQTMMKFEFTIDASHSPKHLDYVNTAGSAKGKTQHGIYTLVGDLLTVCMSAPGAARPTKFESTPGSGINLTAWQRL